MFESGVLYSVRRDGMFESGVLYTVRRNGMFESGCESGWI